MAVLFLVVAVLAPTACVFWFMNDAARNQADAARMSLTEAYRGQMRFLRDNLESFWQKRAADLSDSPVDFRKMVMAGLADSVVYVNSDVPPALAADPLSDRADWRSAEALESRNASAAPAAYAAIAKADSDPSVAARAAQAQVRSLLRAGQKADALQAIRENFVTGRAAKGTDLQGRLIAADERMLALQLMNARDRPYTAAVEHLSSLLNDYHAAIPPAQRLFLMGQLRTLAHVDFPTYEAERLRAQFLEVDSAQPGEPGIQASRVPGVWKLTAKTGRVIALYRTETVLASARSFLDRQNSSSVRFAITPPGSAGAGESFSAGPLLPGWQISFSLLDTKAVDDLARQRTVSYFWVGYLVIAAIAVTGLMVGQSFRRQARLAHLKTDLVAAVSHELKTPLASMRVLVDSLLEDAEFNPRKTREYLELIAGENTRLTRLMENFLTFSRIERNRQRFAFAETKPADVVQAAVNAMRDRLQAPDCHLRVDVTPELPVLNADQDALVTVLLNLLDNAFKYTREDKRISIHAYSQDGHVVFAVEDNGIGIPAREHKRIFRRFYQIDRRLTRETGGCGLGLSIVDFIVRAHGSEVRVQSEAGAGSAFQVLLPCAS